MRYLGGFVFVVALVASPVSVSAQAVEEGTTPELSVVQESSPSAEPAPEEPLLEIELDPAGVGVVPSQLRTVDGYTLEEMDVRVRRAKIGLGTSAKRTPSLGYVVLCGYSADRGLEITQERER
jgi:hypothetical protein